MRISAIAVLIQSWMRIDGGHCLRNIVDQRILADKPARERLRAAAEHFRRRPIVVARVAGYVESTLARPGVAPELAADPHPLPFLRFSVPRHHMHLPLLAHTSPRKPALPRWISRATALLLLAPALASCGPKPKLYEGPTPAELTPDAYVGCYEAEYPKMHDWRPDPRWRLRLYAEAANSQRPSGGQGLPARRATATIARNDDPFWRLIPGGIQLHIGDSLHGVFYEFASRGGGLTGRAFYYSDTRRGFITEPVVARKVECTAAWDSLQ